MRRPRLKLPIRRQARLRSLPVLVMAYGLRLPVAPGPPEPK
jgi:hypothetical protein